MVGEGLAELVGQILRGGGEAGGGAEDLAQDGEIAYDQRDSGGQRLHRGQAEALLERGEGKGVGGRDERREFVVGDRSEDDRVDAEFSGPHLPVGAVVAVVEEGLPARDHQPHVRVLGVQEGVRLYEVQ